MLSKLDLIDALRAHDAEGNGVMTVIVVRPGDAFDLASLGPCPDCAIPGLPNGQRADWRIAADDATGLHGYVFDDRVEFHLDLVDACRYPVGHLVRDTKAVEGAAIGALAIGTVAVLAGAKPPMIVAAVAAGAVGGGLAGAYLPSRAKRVVEFRDLVTMTGAGLVGRENHRGWTS